MIAKGPENQDINKRFYEVIFLIFLFRNDKSIKIFINFKIEHFFLIKL